MNQILQAGISADRRREERQINGVVPGGTVTIKISNKALLHMIEYELGGGLTAAHIESVRTFFNEDEVMNFPGSYLADIDNIYQMDNDPGTSGLMYQLFRDWQGTSFLEDIETSVNMGSRLEGGGPAINEITIQMKIAAAAPNTSTLTVFSHVGPQIAGVVGNKIVGGPGMIKRTFQQTIVGASIGRNDLDTFLPVNFDRQKMYIEKIVFDLPFDNIDRIIIKNGEQEADVLRPGSDLILQAGVGKYFPPNRFIIDKTKEGRGGRYRARSFERFAMELYLKDGAAPLPQNVTYTTHWVGEY